MRAAAHRSLLGLWVAFASVTLGQLWFAHPDTFPRFPHGFAVWITELWTRWDGDRLIDIETLLVYGSCFIAVSLATWAGMKLLRKR